MKEQHGHFPYQVRRRDAPGDEPTFVIVGAWPDTLQVWETKNGDEAFALQQVLNEAYRLGEQAGLADEGGGECQNDPTP